MLIGDNLISVNKFHKVKPQQYLWMNTIQNDAWVKLRLMETCGYASLQLSIISLGTRLQKDKSKNLSFLQHSSTL